MPYLHIPPPWSLPESQTTPERVYFTRRQVLKGLLGLSTAIVAPSLVGCQTTTPDPLKQALDRPPLADYGTNPDFAALDRSPHGSPASGAI